jgi:hypothetical protein
MADLICRLALLAALMSGAWGQAHAQLDRASDVQIKAAYLYQFGGFVDWPPRSFTGPDTPFVIGVIGADAIARELEQVVATRTVRGRRVLVRRLLVGDPLDGLHMLFVGEGQTARLRGLLASAREAPLLVVTESEEGLAQGGMINFVAVGNRVRFDVDLPQAHRSELRISSRLLGVARRVVQG